MRLGRGVKKWGLMASLSLVVSGEPLDFPLSPDPLLLSLSCSALQMHLPISEIGIKASAS